MVGEGDAPLSTVAHLVRFHLHAGGRVALRTLAPVVVAVVFASVMYGSVNAVLAPVAALLFPPLPSIGSALLAVALSTVMAAASAPRLATGLAGWVRHLPASGVDHRRGLTAGLVVAQAPVLAVLVAGGLFAWWGGRGSTTLPRLLGLLPLAWGAALVALPVKSRRARALAATAAAVAWLGRWEGVALAVPLLLIVERVAGRLVGGPPKRLVGGRIGRDRRRTSAAGRGLPAGRLWLVIAWRALRWRSACAWLAAPPVLVPVWLFLRNNRLALDQQMLAVRLCGMVAAVAAMAVLADALVRRRPPWPWIRSLPWSAGARVAYDGLLLLTVAVPVALVAALMAPPSLPSLLEALPLLAMRGSAAIRDGVGRASGASGPLLVEGLAAAGVVALLPWSSAVLLLLAPLAWRLASERERRQPVSQWHELHYLAAGDPLSWSGA